MKVEHHEDHDIIQVNAAEPAFGIQVGIVDLRVHPVGARQGPNCCIHNPSDHHMVDWPLNWRGDRNIMERTCVHGVGHPDPDDVKVRSQEGYGIHGCDGCCRRPDGWVLDGEHRR